MSKTEQWTAWLDGVQEFAEQHSLAESFFAHGDCVGVPVQARDGSAELEKFAQLGSIQDAQIVAYALNTVRADVPRLLRLLREADRIIGRGCDEWNEAIERELPDA